MKELLQCQKVALGLLTEFLKSMPEIRVASTPQMKFGGVDDEHCYITESFSHFMDANLPEVDSFDIATDSEREHPSLVVSHPDSGNNVVIVPTEQSLAIRIQVNNTTTHELVVGQQPAITAITRLPEGISDKLANHVANGGGACPDCGSPEIETTLRYVDINRAAQDATCLICNFNWQDIYTLTGASVQRN